MREPNMKKSSLLVAMLSVFVVLLGIFAWTVSVNAEGETLVMQVWSWSPEVNEKLDQTIEDFNDSFGTNVQVIRYSFSAHWARLEATCAAGSPPDLFWVTRELLAHLTWCVMPLEDLIPDLIARTSSELLDRFTIENARYGLPLGSYDSFGRVAYAIPFQASTEKAELAAKLIRFLREVGFASPFGPFEVGRLPLFSVDDGIVFLQSKANGCLPTFYGQLDPLNGYQLTNASYSVSTSTEDVYMSSVDFELTFWAMHEGNEVVLTGPASFSWKRVDDLTWQLEASFELISGEGETISMRDNLITQSLNKDAYQVDESVHVIYTVDLVPLEFSSESSTIVERTADNQVVAETIQDASIYSGGTLLYSEANTVSMEKMIHTAEHTEFAWTTTSKISEGTYQSGRVHQDLQRYEDRIEVLVDQFDLTVNEERLTLVEPSFIRLKETAEDKFLLSWELALKSSAGALPQISTNAEFVTWSVGEGKLGLAERLTVTIAEYGYEKTLQYYLDPPGFKEYLVKKGIATAAGATTGATGAALTTWWTGPGEVVTVPTGAAIGGIVGDVGYNAYQGLKWAAHKVGLLKDKTPPIIGVGLVKTEWQTKNIGGVDVQRLVTTFRITAVDGESGIKSIKETVGSNPTETHSGDNAPKYTFLFTITDADGAGEISTGQINVIATNGDGVKTLPITWPAIKARGRDTTPPSLSFRQTAKGMEGNCFVAHFEITATDSQSGILSITETVGSNPTETHNAPIQGQKTYIYTFSMKDCQSPYSISTGKVTAKATNAVGVSSAVQSWEACEEGVCLYEHINFGSAMIKFTADDLDLTNNILRNTISWDNVASSIIVSDGWIVTIYEQKNFKGASRVVKGPAQDPDFTKSSWNDKVSSIEVNKSLPSLWQELPTLPAGSNIIGLKKALIKALRQAQKEKLLDFNEALEAIKEVTKLPDTVPEGGLKEDQLPNLKNAVDKVK